MIATFRAARKCRAEVGPATCTIPANGVRASDLTIFPGIWAPLLSAEYLTSYAGLNGHIGRGSAMSRNISWNICLGMTIVCPLGSSATQSLIGSGVASVRRKLPREHQAAIKIEPDRCAIAASRQSRISRCALYLDRGDRWRNQSVIRGMHFPYIGRNNLACPCILRSFS